MSSENAEIVETCPEWADRINDRAVQCKTCVCVYTGRYFSHYARAGEDSSGGWLGGVPKKCTVCEDRRKDDARKAMPLDAGLVAAVKKYAMDHYDDDGWDFVVESYTDAEIWGVIAGSKTERQAVRKIRGVADLLNERRQDVQATAW